MKRIPLRWTLAAAIPLAAFLLRPERPEPVLAAPPATETAMSGDFRCVCRILERDHVPLWSTNWDNDFVYLGPELARRIRYYVSPEMTNLECRANCMDWCKARSKALKATTEEALDKLEDEVEDAGLEDDVDKANEFLSKRAVTHHGRDPLQVFEKDGVELKSAQECTTPADADSVSRRLVQIGRLPAGQDKPHLTFMSE